MSSILRVESDRSEMAERVRESFIHGYKPQGELDIDPSVKLHQEEDATLDPITYEVIRSKLWNLNIDHCEAIKRTSGSQMVAESSDLNIALTNEIGEAVMFGPYSSHFAGMADLIIQWTLEFRSTNPGIGDGDVFIQNDPWVANNHASDVCVYGPLYWEGALFAWIYSSSHHRDVGGPVANSVNPNAATAFDEPALWPPVKLIEGGYLRQDIMDLWTRKTRLPELGALELKSQLAGYRFAYARFIEMIERYGASTVKRAMNRRIEDASKIIGERLSGLPDGIWRDEAYVAGASATDLKPYKSCLTFEKRGDRLRVSNAGTDPAVGVLNGSYAAFRGAIVGPLLGGFGWDVELCGAGLWRQVDVDVEPGTLTGANYPTAVGSSIGVCIPMAQGTTLTAKMVSGDEDLSTHARGPGALHTMSCLGIAGQADQYGKPFGGVFMDRLEGGVAATAKRDGFEGGGIPDVEQVERWLPALCLYRRSLSTSGGHGRFRGGGTVDSAYIGHKGGNAGVIELGMIPSVTLGKTADGAWPSTGGTQRVAPDSTVHEWFQSGRIPTNSDELNSVAKFEKPEKVFKPFTNTSIYHFVCYPGGGFGDPITRDPSAVASDLRQGLITEEDVLDVYGVVISNSDYDEDATRGRREDLLKQRVAESQPPREPCEGSFDLKSEMVHALASVVLSPSGTHLGCAHCGQHLSTWAGNFRLGCRELERTLPSLSPLFEDPESDTGMLLVFRQYLCPTCNLAVDGDVCQPTDAPYPAFELLA